MESPEDFIVPLDKRQNILTTKSLKSKVLTLTKVNFHLYQAIAYIWSIHNVKEEIQQEEILGPYYFTISKKSYTPLAVNTQVHLPIKRSAAPLTNNENSSSKKHEKVTLRKCIAEVLGVLESTVGQVIHEWNQCNNGTFPEQKPIGQPNHDITTLLHEKITNSNKSGSPISTPILQNRSFFTLPYHCELQPIEGIWAVVKGERSAAPLTNNENSSSKKHEKVTLRKCIAEVLGVLESTVGQVIHEWNQCNNGTFPEQKPIGQPNHDITTLLHEKITNSNKSGSPISTPILQNRSFFTLPYHCELQPIEGIWAVVKGEVSRSGPHKNLLKIRNKLFWAFKEKINSKTIIGIWKRALINAKKL
ncbi:hypothetical protein Glove_157g5 [Diversispora epigaea]|uniref:Tc1-like transposase DDE domain-containing protein n=1 Tax=Diversispora epigaea TaxID=1348612 RepID=A0A397J1F5_9GLOM|nr:hypothetical protein Glove_157g5 [Diversispora epigaea]